MSPLVSVIIPTSGRPQFLRRAIDSALAGLPGGQVEVIVVPNGPDMSWRDALRDFEGHAAVRVLPVGPANANAARNRGLLAATGRYVRFLDDDDYFYPEACRAQYELLERTGADICSGDVDILDWRGRIMLKGMQPHTDDFATATVCPDRRAIPVMHVFRRPILDGMQWRESQPFLQDVQWLFDLCARADYRWVKVNMPVGTWQHHWGQRTSRRISRHAKQQHIARMIRETVAQLEAAGRMTAERHAAAAAGYWQCIHMAFYVKPLYWYRFAREVAATYPDARPNIGLYRYPAARRIDPILVETVMLPKRWLNHAVRSVADRLELRHHL